MSIAPYQHTPERRGYANGFKPKAMRTRVGELTFAVPQVRKGGFYPQALDKGLGSEPALTLAPAEMYVQGLSTHKVKATTEQLCRVTVSFERPGARVLGGCREAALGGKVRDERLDFFDAPVFRVTLLMKDAERVAAYPIYVGFFR